MNKSEQGWQPIESAPKDGSYFIAGKFKNGDELLYVCDCRWMTADQFFEEFDDWIEDDAPGGFVNDEQGERWPTHWMPLNSPEQS